MAILKSEFITFYNEEVKYDGNNEIREKKKKLKEDFKSKFPTKFKEKYEEDIKVSDIRFIDQGSYNINTTINHTDTAFDIDVATIINLDINKYNNVLEIKQLVRDALKNTNREPKIKEPCVTVKYTKAGEEKYHIDFPIYASHEGKLYLARGKESDKEEDIKWEIADPEGLSEYFKKDHLQIEGLNLDEEEKKKRKQKRRIIRYIKWWKAEKYGTSRRDHSIPPSIALTILVCEHFESAKIDDEYNDLNALYKTVKNIAGELFEKTFDEDDEEIISLKECKLPKDPGSDCFFKIRNSYSYIKTFYTRWTTFESNLKKAVEEDDERTAGEIVAKMFGDKFPLPEVDEVNSEDSFAK
ncbi:cyclic GMP-AMP synthase DncV-like nucleotidyltransferase [Clostridium perfringens]|uniref:cyclic GMP-AMP synthase DncV-like nucleotidyltransferase n=1 Tax=Clostridium culturomicium TaxID=1499683 RepID=UPI00058CA745|nr:hypothetical protein [Clostridium culturomicium]